MGEGRAGGGRSQGLSLLSPYLSWVGILEAAASTLGRPTGALTLGSGNPTSSFCPSSPKVAVASCHYVWVASPSHVWFLSSFIACVTKALY